MIYPRQGFQIGKHCLKLGEIAAEARERLERRKLKELGDIPKDIRYL